MIQLLKSNFKFDLTHVGNFFYRSGVEEVGELVHPLILLHGSFMTSSLICYAKLMIPVHWFVVFGFGCCRVPFDNLTFVSFPLSIEKIFKQSSRKKLPFLFEEPR